MARLTVSRGTGGCNLEGATGHVSDGLHANVFLLLNLLVVKMGCEGDCGADPLPQDSFLLLNLRLCMEPLTTARERIKGSKDVRGARLHSHFD